MGYGALYHTPFVVVMSASKTVASAILGTDFTTVVVNGKSYMMPPPTISRIAGASLYLSEWENVESVKGIILSLKNIDNASKALSWLINGDEGLSEELAKGTFEEVVSALETGYELISVENFIRLSILSRNVGNLIAKRK